MQLNVGKEIAALQRMTDRDHRGARPARLAAAAYFATAYVANSWAAWAPPGEVNPNYARLVFAARLYGTLALCSSSVAVAVVLLPSKMFRR